MEVLIYGRSQGCKYCDRAKTICEMNNYDVTFVDVTEANLDGAALAEICGVPVRTVPQIFVNGEYVGGCTEFETLLKG